MTIGRYEASEEDPLAPEPDDSEIACDSCGRSYFDWQGSIVVRQGKERWVCDRCQEEEEA